MSQVRRLARSLTLGYGYQITVMAVGVFLTPLFLSRLGNDSYGQWLVFGQLLVLLGLLDLGVSSVLSRDVAVAGGGADPARAIPEVVRRTTWLVWLQIPAVAIVAGITWDATAYARPDLAGPMAVLLASFTALFPVRVYGVILLGLQDLVFGTWTNAAGWATTTGLSIALVFAGMGLYALAIGWAAGQSVAASLNYLRVRTQFPVARNWSGYPGRAALWLQLRPSLWGSLYQFAANLSIGTDLLVIGWLLGPEAVVLYSCTTKLPTVTLHLLNTIVTASIPALSGLRAGGDMERYWRAVRAVGITLLLASGLAAVGLVAINAAFVSTWVGPGRFAGPLVSLLAVVLLLARHYTITLTGPGFTLGRERRLALILIAEGLVCLGATAAWTKALGLVGVPLGGLTGLGLVTIPFSLVMVADKAGLSPMQVLHWAGPWFFRLVVVLLPVAAASFLLSANRIWIGAALAASGALAYVAIAAGLLWRDPLGSYEPLGVVRRLLHVRARQ